MKRLTALAAILAIASFAVYAGPYLNVELNPIDRLLPVTIGVDGVQTEPVGEGVLTLTGDFYLSDVNFWVWPSTWILGGSVGVAYGGTSIELSSVVYWDPLAWPGLAEIVTWDTSLELSYQASDVVTVYGIATWDYVAEWSVWGFTPILGLDCDW